MMPVTWTDLLAILNRIATQRHSRAVSIAVGYLVCSEPLLNLEDDIWFREEFIWPPRCICFGEFLRTLKSFFRR